MDISVEDRITNDKIPFALESLSLLYIVGLAINKMLIFNLFP